MTAALAERAVVGVVEPRVEWMPPGEHDYRLGERCITWARDTLHQELDEWEQLAVRRMLARRPDGRFVCPEFGMCVSRRNGKSHVIVVVLLFLILEVGVVAAEYTAHHGRTVRETFRLAQRILHDAGPVGCDWKAYASDGRERLVFDFGDQTRTFSLSTRTGSAGRGTGADVVVVDEAQEASDDEMDAIAPTLGDRSAAGNPLLLYAGSAGNFESVVFGRVRRRALQGDSDRLGWIEYSIDVDAYFCADTFERERIVRDPASAAQANPAVGRVRKDGSGLGLDWLMAQIDVLSPAGFAREHLGVGTWPKDDAHDWVIPRAAWNARRTEKVPDGRLVLALSAAWGVRTVALAVAGASPESGCTAWLERLDEGTAWVLGDVARLIGAHDVAAVVLDAGGPAAPLVPELEKALTAAGVTFEKLSARDVGMACGGLADAVTEAPPSFSHLGQLDVDAALAGARKKDLGDGLWVFDRRKSETDTAPLEAVVLARYGFTLHGDDDDVWGFYE